jgi:hypothetical protein
MVRDVTAVRTLELDALVAAGRRVLALALLPR